MALSAEFANNQFLTYGMEKICAICHMKLDAEPTHYLFRKIISDMDHIITAFQALQSFSKFSISSGPQHLCNSCFHKTNFTYKFMLMCNRAQVNLENYIRQRKELAELEVLKANVEMSMRQGDIQIQNLLNDNISATETIESEYQLDTNRVKIEIEETNDIEDSEENSLNIPEIIQVPKEEINIYETEISEHRVASATSDFELVVLEDDRIKIKTESDFHQTSFDTEDAETDISPDTNNERVSSDSDGDDSSWRGAKLPERSRDKYELVYQRFMDWRRKKNKDESITENLMLTYFEELATIMKPSSLWPKYSMLRATINQKHPNINIATYSKLLTFLKDKAKEFKRKQNKFLCTRQINDFLQSAPDEQYLFMKVVLIFEFSGGCRRQELQNIRLEHVEDTGESLIVTIPDATSKSPCDKQRYFLVPETYYPTCKKYMNLRPPGEDSKYLPFFVYYANGKCTKFRAGINKFGSIGKRVAAYLGLPDAKEYGVVTKLHNEAMYLPTLEEQANIVIKEVTETKPPEPFATDANDEPMNLIHTIANMQNPMLLYTQEQERIRDAGDKFVNESETDEDIPPAPRETIEKPENSTNKSLVPEKSREKYEYVYQRFMDWRVEKKADSFSESVMMTYFQELATKMKPSSLWSTYSMLRATINLKHPTINIATYTTLLTLLRKKSKGFKSKKSPTLTLKNINDFLQNAPDKKYLFMKVVLIFGVSGGCRKQEFRNMKPEHVEDTGKSLIITIPDSLARPSRYFVVSESNYPTCKRYMNLRPSFVGVDKDMPFFLQYLNGKCTSQVVGINTFGSISKKIAEFLGLPDPKQYTGHSLRCSSSNFGSVKMWS